MADGTPKQPPKKATPFPSNWARMSAAEKRAWQDEQRKKQGIAVKPAEPVRPTKPAPVQQQDDEYDQEQPEQEGTTLETEGGDQQEQCDEVTVTIKMPGQDVREMTGREFVRKLLGGLYDAFGGASGVQ